MFGYSLCFKFNTIKTGEIKIIAVTKIKPIDN